MRKFLDILPGFYPFCSPVSHILWSRIWNVMSVGTLPKIWFHRGRRKRWSSFCISVLFPWLYFVLRFVVTSYIGPALSTSEPSINRWHPFVWPANWGISDSIKGADGSRMRERKGWEIYFLVYISGWWPQVDSKVNIRESCRKQGAGRCVARCDYYQCDQFKLGF